MTSASAWCSMRWAACSTALARYPIDLPDRPGEESSREIGKWQRHATLGYALDEQDAAGSVGVTERDWNGVIRTVTEQRREEHRHVDRRRSTNCATPSGRAWRRCTTRSRSTRRPT